MLFIQYSTTRTCKYFCRKKGTEHDVKAKIYAELL